jgi:hypothetical protein
MKCTSRDTAWPTITVLAVLDYLATKAAIRLVVMTQVARRFEGSTTTLTSF